MPVHGGSSGGSSRSVDHTYHNYSRYIELGGVVVEKTRSTFPAKLHEMVSDGENKGVIEWMPHGRAWKILDKDRFISSSMTKYFAHTKFESFTRQLSGWGFKRLHQKGMDHGCYYHEMFLQGMPRLTNLMKRENINFGKALPDEKAEPDFTYIAQLHPLPSAASSSTSSKQDIAVPQISTATAAAPPVTYPSAPHSVLQSLDAQICSSTAKAQQNIEVMGGLTTSQFGGANLDSFTHSGHQSMLTGLCDQPLTQGISLSPSCLGSSQQGRSRKRQHEQTSSHLLMDMMATQESDHSLAASFQPVSLNCKATAAHIKASNTKPSPPCNTLIPSEELGKTELRPTLSNYFRSVEGSLEPLPFSMYHETEAEFQGGSKLWASLARDFDQTCKQSEAHAAAGDAANYGRLPQWMQHAASLGSDGARRRSCPPTFVPNTRESRSLPTSIRTSTSVSVLRSDNCPPPFFLPPELPVQASPAKTEDLFVDRSVRRDQEEGGGGDVNGPSNPIF